MKRFFTFTIFLLLSIPPLASQSIQKFSIDSGGDSILANDIQMLFTIGEVVIQEIPTATVSVSEGFINSSFNATLNTNDYVVSTPNINIYPNPANQFIYIDSDVPISKVSFFDALGRNVWQSTSISNAINVSAFQAGVYVIVLYHDDVFVSKRFVIQ